MKLNTNEVQQLNDFEDYLAFKTTWSYAKFLHIACKKILLIYGNQGGKTGGTSHSYVKRIMGQHPIADKNVVYYKCEGVLEKECNYKISPYKVPQSMVCPDCGKKLIIHERGTRTMRFCSQTLPGQTSTAAVDGGTSEVKNTQYPEFKKWLPKFLIKKDITARNPAMVIADPFGGKDIVVEFVSYSQQVQAGAGVQRMSIWCDEAPDSDFYEEQLPRLLAEDGDILFTYTPVDRSSWLFDEFFEKAKYFYRTQRICDYLKSEGKIIKREEVTNSPYDIAVVMAATDDNPTLDPDVVEALFNHIDDPDTVAIRRYGIFKQLSGRIFKNFDYATHVLSKEKYFPDGLPYNWLHARGIDFHAQTPWAVGFAAMSPENEVFIYKDWNPSPEKYTIKEMSSEIAHMGEDYDYKLNLIDPYAEAIKKDSISVLMDLNREFKELKREGIGTGGYWLTWDTKNEKGRDEIRRRLKNSLSVGRPFNNKVTDKFGRTTHLPTIWVLDTCITSAKHMKNWRWEEWSDSKNLIKKEEKNKPEQKWSHMNMVWEALFKHTGFKPRSGHRVPDRKVQYFNRSR